MAQTKRKRNRKHRGTQAGTVEARGRTSSRPKNTKTDARAIRQARREERMNKPPSWRSSFNRAAISAIVFGIFTVLAFGWEVQQAAPLTAVMVLIYLPLSYYTDRLIYNRRQRQKAARAGR
jgi:Flp pilus assembly protein TadB